MMTLLLCLLGAQLGESRRMLKGTTSISIRGGRVSTENPEEHVNLLAGTSTPDGGSNSNGNVLPQLKRPRGFNDWAPQTNAGGDSWWFRRQDSEFFGMRCTHQPSPWIGDYASFLVVPHVEETPSALSYSSSEAAFHPYYFQSLLLDESGSKTSFEFTATSHAAMARVHFNVSKKGSGGHISVKLSGGDLEFEDGMIRGRSLSISHKAPAGWKGLFIVAKPLGSATLLNEPAYGVVTLRFAGEEPARLAVGTSFISLEQAERNLEEELGDKSFEELVEDGKKEWRDRLSSVKVTVQDKSQLKVFYTNLWRSLLFPRYLDEVDEHGNTVHYSPYTGKVQKGEMVADSGFWDAYRSVYTLQSIIAPKDLGKVIEGWVRAKDEAGWLPQWASPDQVNSMVGTMGDSVLADAIAKQKWGFLEGFDVEEAYAAIRKDAFEEGKDLFGRQGLKDYIEKGYVPADSDDESVTRTQGYYIADAAIARAAKLLGKDADYKTLSARSQRYTELFNTRSFFFEPKQANGAFKADFDPLAWRNGFTEGCAWQYRFDVPHDISGLQRLYGGHLCEAVSAMLRKPAGSSFHVGGYGQVIHEMREADAMSQDFGFLAHSNQPSHHVLWIAKRAGCHHVADANLRKVLRLLYTTEGWSGDEDNGEMASWYVLTALGIFQLQGAEDEIVLGSPAVVEATVQLPHGRTLKVSTENQGPQNVHVVKVTWTPHEGTSRIIKTGVLKYTELMRGGVLTFTLDKEGVTPTSPRSAVTV